MTWARMKFKPKKSRFAVIKKGCLIRNVTMRIQGEEIPQLVDNPVKALGKWYDDSLGDHRNVDNIKTLASTWLTKVDKSGLPGKYKAWIYQHGILPRLSWHLTLYEIPMSMVEALEKKVNQKLRRWLGVPQSFCSIGLYSRSCQLQLPLSSVVEEFKVAKCRLVLTLRDSADAKVREAGVFTGSGRKWSARAAVAESESSLQLKDVIGNTCIGRQGIGMSQFKEWNKAQGKAKKDMVLGEVRKEEEQKRRSKAVELAKQGAWTRWNLPERQVSWPELWKLEPARISFLLRSVYDTLPSPANLHTWGLTEDPSCHLCGGRGTMAHILSGCKTALQQGRYRWRHDQVLAVLADSLEKERKQKRAVGGSSTLYSL